MTTIRESSLKYEVPETRNVADLEKINIMQDIFTKEVGTLGDEGYFKYDYIVVHDVEYRVPASVRKQIKTLIGKYPDLTEVRVIREGEGMKTSYMVERVA